MAEGSALEVATAFLEAMVDTSRVDAAERFLAGDVHVIINGTTFSRAEYLDRLETSDEQFEMVDVTIGTSLTAGRRAAFTQELLIEHRGTAYGVEPGHERFTECAASIVTVEDNLITEIEITHDPTATLEALGLLSADPTTEKLRDQYYEILNRVLRHNLRNKLNVILASVETFESDPDAAAATIKEKTAGLLSTVEKAQKIEQMAIDTPLSPTQFHVTDTITEVLDQYERHHSVSCRCVCPDESLELRSDRSLFQNILEETIQNAILYTNTETPEVTVTARPASGQGVVELEIEDNGPGIPESELEPLRQDQETQLLHGSGIGLWITKWCVTRLEGQITFGTEKEPTVHITLPNLGH
ncbi:Histidine kinase-, DNA gyrase B-, and HSP90-like ATPase [Halovenus aranensis]|jgi:signal transduction histidine kinase|uniref:Histidine kinase-, DNA gyrase B-, and HSP90-like ATPase n=1 Tax=Halovenus aranensis TaxID=890420 RepID=A0A1G8S8N2_9EURY|nr:ATP-binding protein [Halovenus aranensis]SDJ25541.1 Histidine kinase-, DNA gyrase B-, and HSP90-like ATPase [Halovenus aranensis]